MVVYAKSRPPETLVEHTQCLLDNLQGVKYFYGDTILQRVPVDFRPVFWDALEIVAKCHDLGKIHTPFQNKIRKILKQPLLPVPNVVELPHNLLSPAFIKPLVEGFTEDVRAAIYQAITFHHFRGVEDEYIKNYPGRWDQLIEVLEKDLTPIWHERLAEMNEILPLDSIGGPKPLYLRYLKQEKIIKAKDGDLYRFYVLLKGLLHRLDHSASAHLATEEELISESVHCVTNYLLTQQGIELDSIWQKNLAAGFSNQNVVLTASTGIGKTEFALYWLNGQKGFYTLPVRTSVNAMYDRLRETFDTKDRIGLLHSDAYFYCLDDRADTPQANSNEEGALQSLHYVDVSRQFAMPITVSTADQLFTSVFKYKGYEKIYATLSYSKVIIDEIQAYDSEIAAVILQGLVEIVRMGGQFCIVTATLPPIYREYLETHIPNIGILPPKYLPAQKHKVKLEPCSIDSDDALRKIADLYRKYKKVLIIVNTVKKAQLLYQRLEKSDKNLPLSLLHSGFIYQDRQSKETEILNRNTMGIWITTQLAEVSLNIDFPVLLTEIATIDALIQRMGRVLRFVEPHFVYDGDPNIFIYQDASGIGTIYDKEILEKTTGVLKEIEGSTLNEEQKAQFVERIFARPSLQGTKYYDLFLNSMQMLASGLEVDTRREAQKLFRRISNLAVIPFEVYGLHIEEISNSLKALENKQTTRLEKFRALAALKNFTVSVPMFRLSNVNRETLRPLKGHDLFLLNMRYESTLGLQPSEQMENVF